MSLPNNFNHQIYQSDLLVPFMVKQFYRSDLPVVSMTRKNSTTNGVLLKNLTTKCTGKFDQ